MRPRCFIVFLISAFIIPVGVFAQQWPDAGPEAKPGVRWWWMGSAVDEENLAWNMEQYASHGIGALEITPIYGVRGNEANYILFLSDKWMEMLRFTQEQGRKNGILIDMDCGTGWPFGGPDVPLEEAACKVVFLQGISAPEDAGSLVLNLPDSVKAFSRRVLRRVYPSENPGTVRVIELYISRTRQKVKVAAPGGEGYVIDHFDSTAVAHYLANIEKAFERTGTPYPHSFFNDSYEVYGADWTPRFLEEFVARRGYKLEDYLPEFLGHSRCNDPSFPAVEPKTRAELTVDYRLTLSELLLKNFTRQWVNWCHKHGVKVRNQAHGSPANLIDCYSEVDIPEIEGFGLSDFGIKGLRTDPGNVRKNDSDLSMLKYAPSASHINGKPFTSSETFTWLTEHYRTSLSQMKPDMDLMFCAGVNNMYFHGTCYSPKDDPWPGWQFYASVNMSPTNSTWRDAPYLMKYIERCQSFLQWGKPDNDFLVYLTIRDMWKKHLLPKLMLFSIHEMGKLAPGFIKDIIAIEKAGFDCDYISDSYLLKTSFVDGMVQTHAGTRYKGIIIPRNSTVSEDVAAHLEALKKKGARIIYGVAAADLAAAAVPEQMKLDGLSMIRRANDRGYHYFISNLSPKDYDSYVPLAVSFKDAMWFDAMTGRRYAAEMVDGKVRVSLKSGESLILETFNTPVDEHLTPKPVIADCIADIGSGWRLSFIESWPEIGKSYAIDGLCTREGLDEQTRILMGTGVYETSFRIDRSKVSKTMAIDLGDVRESARVYINGKEIGCAWAVPYVLTFDGRILKKKNTIRIEVTNLPANRISEMDRKGVNWRKFKKEYYDVR
ncbi:MAG: glycosyl hydrolase family 2, partial [Bacteroidales bacterium]|nr:glycosyl hydrolase family 2 [Bacteroidales bacterium]